MNVLVIGSGGREHAIIKKLKENKNIKNLFCAPGNGGISKDAVCVDINACDTQNMVSFCKEKNIDFAVVAPDDPLVAGMVDALEKENIKCFGPNKSAAIIEGSKVFSKNLMKKYNIPTAKYEVFYNADDAIEYIKKENTYPTVIKADGLALGKGVIIAENFEDAKNAVNSIMTDKKFGESGNKIVIEEFLTGPEVSVLAFCDSHTIVPMVSAMDHKRALDGDKGLNTGGMGTVAPNPHYTQDVAKECMEKIFIPTMNAMNSENRRFKGVIFFGLMITPNGAKVIEYNCRFGDPETQVVLPLLKTDLFEILKAVADEKLKDINIEFKTDEYAVCVIEASDGYPLSYPKGITIEGLDENGNSDKALIFHAGTVFENGKFKTNGGRVLGVTQTADTLEKAIEKAYNATNYVKFENMHIRHDIGKKALI